VKVGKACHSGHAQHKPEAGLAIRFLGEERPFGYCVSCHGSMDRTQSHDFLLTAWAKPEGYCKLRLGLAVALRESRSFGVVIPFEARKDFLPASHKMVSIYVFTIHSGGPIRS